MRKITLEKQTYTFSDYFNLNYEIEDILAYFDYSLRRENLALPQAPINMQEVNALKIRMDEVLPHIGLTSEQARREFLIAPVIGEVVRMTHANVRVEYAIEVSQKLKGTLDYYFSGKENLLVVEAKHADPQRGFAQLSVEMVALDQWTDSDSNCLYGAISLGESWRFARLDRTSKIISQDLDLYSVPTNMEQLIAVLVGILRSEG